MWKRAAWIAGTGCVLAASVYVLTGYYKINWYTDSMPRGIYRIEHRLPARGDIAASCLTPEIVTEGRERHYLPPFPGRGCSHQLYPMAKYVYGIPGDTVRLEGHEIVINGEPTGLHRLKEDSVGRPMPVLPQPETQLGEGEYWLMSHHRPNSYDSRYFGAVPVMYTLKPVWTLE